MANVLVAQEPVDRELATHLRMNRLGLLSCNSRVAMCTAVQNVQKVISPDILIFESVYPLPERKRPLENAPKMKRRDSFSGATVTQDHRVGVRKDFV